MAGALCFVLINGHVARRSPKHIVVIPANSLFLALCNFWIFSTHRAMTKSVPAVKDIAIVTMPQSGRVSVHETRLA